MRDIVNSALGNLLFGVIVWAIFKSLHFFNRRITMSKNKTADDNQQTAEEPTTETTPVETPAQSKPGKTKKLDYVCPACKHTSGVTIGAPYQKGELKLQYVQCEKCHHLSAEIV